MYTIQILKARQPKLGEWAAIKYEGMEAQMGQIGSNNTLHKSPIFNDDKNVIYVQFAKHPEPIALLIDKIERFELILQVPMKAVHIEKHFYSYQPA